MSLKRAVLVIWILLHMALIGVYFEVRGVELRYRLVEKRQRLQAAALERQGLVLAVESARQPGGLERKARALGIDVKSESAMAVAGRSPRGRP